MAEETLSENTIGWIGTGRMGYAMVARLLKAGCDVAVYNRTRAKAEPLTELGARIVDTPGDLADRDIVFTMIAGPADLKAVTFGDNGLFTRAGTIPKMLVDCSSVSAEASSEVRARAGDLGAAMLAAPVSGNAKVVKAGKLSIVASGPQASFDMAEPYLDVIGEGVTYVGDGEHARMVKICHNVLLGVVTQSLAEITILAERGGVPRHAFLDFINKSVMGCRFTKYKTPSFVNLDFTPTFTPALLKKDLDLGLQAARELEVPMPVAATVREIVQQLMGNGYVDCDFAALLELQATNSNYKLESENMEIDDGL